MAHGRPFRGDGSMSPGLRHLTIKPFHGCSHHCPYCDSRQELFRQSRDATLGLEDWAGVLRDANDLGVEYLDISGGEPTLYGALPALIWEAKRYGWYVSINSTGFRVPELLDRLLEVCLDQVIVSLVSLDEATHDAVRQTPGSWRDAVRAMRAIRETPLRLIVHYIVHRHNYAELPALFDFAHAEGAHGVALVYPENDAQDRHLLLSADDVEHFRSVVRPAAERQYRQRFPQALSSQRQLAGLYGADLSAADYAAGRYWPDLAEIHQRCDKPLMFALIYANGDVLPCNAVEYTHSPVVGNVLRDRLPAIWQGDAWNRFRQERMPFCGSCPIKRHTGVGIRSEANPPYTAPVIRQVPPGLPAERPAVPPAWQQTRVPRRRKAELPVRGGSSQGNEDPAPVVRITPLLIPGQEER